MYHKSLFPDIPDVPEQNVHELLFNRPDQQSWTDYTLHVNASTGERRSYREFLERVRDGGTALGTAVEQGGLGLRAEDGEIVGILSENCLDYIALLHSCLIMTVPFTMFSSYSTAYEFKHAVTLSQATRIFVSASLLPLALSSGLPDDRIYILDGHVDGRTSFDDLVSQVRKNSIPRLPIRHAKRDTLAYLIFSSGTSGLPKAVMISHGNLIVSLLQVFVSAAETAKIQEPQKWNGPEGIQVLFNVLPIHHAYGLHVTSFRVFFVPVTIILLPKWDANLYLDTIPKYRVTSIYLVPSLVHQLVHHPRFATADFSTVQVVQCGAAYLPAQLADQFRARIPSVERVGEGYGMSECTLSISAKPLPGLLEGRAKNVPGSAGILSPGVEARVLREDGSLAGENEAGELYVRAGCVALGYWNNERATKETFIDGWLRTGDRIRINQDGVLFFEDRAKDTLKVSGMQVSPVEIENTLLAHPARLIQDASVAGVSGGRTSDERVPRAWVVLSPSGRALGPTQAIARLDAWVRETLSKYKWLRGGIAVVEQIPKSPSGKVLRRVLVDEYEEQRKALRARL
ncbi:acetyl-CoA synthetase-like protein [Leucogyrophana mollusca]|uniref:Acetyl-CoA synthetase-like protein n=1 Tax=Leucogyrophana mollusca TaxID=85980 RepID=A0ACB8BCH2_9AGAM|nr:acetyl-CoA synthetase-like protein [Leucogyrophana mollusca]